jgi:hypothetical protein
MAGIKTVSVNAFPCHIKTSEEIYTSGKADIFRVIEKGIQGQYILELGASQGSWG